MIDYAQIVEWMAGAVLIALCSLWFAREVGLNRRRRMGIAAWVGLWLVAVGASIVALHRAEAALSDVPPDDRIVALSKWVAVFETAQTASRLAVVMGCLVVFGVWMVTTRR